MTVAPVPYDPELEAGLAEFIALVEPFPLRADTIAATRELFTTIIRPLDEVVGDAAVDYSHHTVPGPRGAPEVELTVLRPREVVGPVPGIYCIHGGGMVTGDRFFGAEGLVADALSYGAVVATVDYRLAPENPAPAPAEDCYAGLAWFAGNAELLGVDPERILVGGSSAGGGLSAAVALMARDRGGPTLAGQLLSAPMIDDRNETVSSRQYDGLGAWDRNNNDTGWNALLGAARGTDAVSPYAAPARARDLAGLAPAYVDVGAAEVFRDESIDYANRIWAAGGRAELHVWSGGYHGFAGSSPDAVVSRAAMASRDSWIRRVLGIGQPG